MSALTVGSLTPAYIGAHARVGLPAATRNGVLTFAANPSYHRTVVRHWWLLVPSALPHFKHDALSLQWSGSAPVEITKEATA